jgi:hypothetical protein
VAFVVVDRYKYHVLLKYVELIKSRWTFEPLKKELPVPFSPFRQARHFVSFSFQLGPEKRC